MQLLPVLAALRRNRLSVSLIALQMAITLAVLCNAVSIIEQRVAASRRPSGVEESAVFVIGNQMVGAATDAGTRIAVDLAALRALPGVADAYVTNSYPMSNSGWGEGCSRKPDQSHSTTLCALYFGDEHALATLGLKLIAGRNFLPSEVRDRHRDDLGGPAAVIITRRLAEVLFPGRDALNQTLYLESVHQPATVVGVVDRLQVPWTAVGGWGSGFFENSVIEPFHYIAPNHAFVLRVWPGALARVMVTAQKKLYAIDRNRVLDTVQTMAEVRREAYKDDRGIAAILGVVCLALLAVTGFGIVGLTSYWVTQRRRQIGIRRALGATRGAIMRYFQLENLLIAAAASAAGAVLAIGLNRWLLGRFEMARLHGGYVIAGALSVLLLGQLAVFWPARRASAVPPALAARGA